MCISKVTNDELATENRSFDRFPVRRIKLLEGKGNLSQSIEADDTEVVCSGTAVGRRAKDEVILFKSVGLAIEDVAIGAKLVELANKSGRGKSLSL